MNRKEDKIVDDIKKIASGDTLNSRELLDFVATHNTEAELLAERLESADRVGGVRCEVRGIDTKKEIDRLVEEAKQINNKRKRVAFFRIASSVAAVLVFSLFMVSRFIDNSTNKHQFAEEKFAVGLTEINIPTLITENGAYGLSEDVENIGLADSYNLKKESGGLVYGAKSDNQAVKAEVIYNTLQIPAKFTYKVVLCDSTVVTLNAGSALRYPVNFDGDERVVELSGEAFFEVTKSDKPFIVKSKGVNIRVYGTKFNVNSNDNQVETVLVRGKVGVSSDIVEEVILTPNSMAVFDFKSEEIILEEDISITDYLVWLNGSFYYNNQPLHRVVSDIERWYGVDIRYDESVKDMSITVNIKKNNDVNKFLEFFELIIDKKIVREESEVYQIID